MSIIPTELKNICIPTDTSGMSPEAIKLVACRDAAACLTNATKYNIENSEYNKKQNEALSVAIKAYEIKNAEYKVDLDNWTKRKGKYSIYAKYDGESRNFWANETDGTCWAGENWNAAHEWCHNAANNKGYDGENYWAKSWGWCSGRYGNFECKKDTNVMESQRKQYQDVKPIFTDKRPSQEDFPLKTNVSIDGITLQCCSNFVNVTGNAADISQTCEQTINNKIEEIGASIPSPSPFVPPAPVTAPAPVTVSAPAPVVSNGLIVAIVLALFFIVFSSMIVVVLY